MDPTRPRRKISAGLSVGRAFHPIIAVNRFAFFLFFPFSLSLPPSPFAELSRIASRRYIRSRVKPASLSLSLSLFPSFYFHRDPCQVHTTVYPLSIPSPGWDRASFSYYIVRFQVSAAIAAVPTPRLARRLSFFLSLSFLLFFNLECFTRFYEDLGSLSYHRAFMPLSESRNF